MHRLREQGRISKISPKEKINSVFRYDGGLFFCSTANGIDNCATYSIASDAWTAAPSYQNPNSGSIGIIGLLDMVWFIGGYANNDSNKAKLGRITLLNVFKAINTTEIFKEGEWHPGPTYPHKVRGVVPFPISDFAFLSCGGVVIKE